MKEAKPEDDEANASDLEEATKCIKSAQDALATAQAVTAGRALAWRETFIELAGVALSRLVRVWSRIGDGERP